MNAILSSENDSKPSGSPFNVGSFLAGFTAFALERWLHHRGMSGADDPKAGKKKRKKLQKQKPKNFFQASLKEFAQSYPDSPKEANGSVKKWLLRQVTDPRKIWVMFEALSAARGLVGRLGHKSIKGKQKKKKSKKSKGSKMPGAEALQPLIEAGVSMLAAKGAAAGKKKDKNKEAQVVEAEVAKPTTVQADHKNGKKLKGADEKHIADKDAANANGLAPAKAQKPRG